MSVTAQLGHAIDDLPVVVVDGQFRLPSAQPVCHGYACCCECASCTEREQEHDAQPAGQPWEPRPISDRWAAA
jgi:hypothetical protein